MYKQRIRDLAQEYYNKAFECVSLGSYDNKSELLEELEDLRRSMDLSEYQIEVGSNTEEDTEENQNPFKTREIRNFFDALTKLRKKLNL